MWGLTRIKIMLQSTLQSYPFAANLSSVDSVAILLIELICVTVRGGVFSGASLRAEAGEGYDCQQQAVGRGCIKGEYLVKSFKSGNADVRHTRPLCC